MTPRQFFKTIWGAPGNPIFFLSPPQAADTAVPGGALPAPQFLFFFTTAESAAPPKGEGNPAEGGCFASHLLCPL